jgi:hypothetical protein
MNYWADHLIRLSRGVSVYVFLVVWASPSLADTGAVANGDWSNAATWTNGVPGASDNVYIGSTAPTGAAAAATVALSQNSSAGNVFLGNGFSTSGALDLAGQVLAANHLYLGSIGGTGRVLRTGGGTLAVGSVYDNGYGSSFALAPADVVSNLTMGSISTVSTSSVANLTNSVLIQDGGTLALGADLALSGTLQLRGTLNANSHAVSANAITAEISGVPVFVNPGSLTASTLTVSNSTAGQTSFNLTTADTVSGFRVNGVNTTLAAGVSVQNLGVDSGGGITATATTSTVGNVTGSAFVYTGCTLTLGGDLNLTGNLSLSGTINANGHAISAVYIYLTENGSPFAIFNRGSITATNVDITSYSG